MKIGVMYGNPETTTGGNALKFYASVRLDIRRIGQIKDRDDIVGNTTRVKVVKNKVAPPFRQAEFDILFTSELHGINRHGDIIDLAAEYDVVKKLGSFYSYGDLRLGQGRMNSAAYLREHEELSAEIEALVRTAAGLKTGAVVDDAVLAKPDDEDVDPEAMLEAIEAAVDAETADTAELVMDA